MAATSLELSDFLAQVDLLHLQERLTAEDIDMTVLPLLDDGDLKELGLSLGQRRKLLKGLQSLNGDASPSATSPDVPGTNPVQLRRLSVLFCDMVGSTQLGEQLDIDEMQIVLQHYYTVAETVARRHNGRATGLSFCSAIRRSWTGLPNVACWRPGICKPRWPKHQ